VCFGCWLLVVVVVVVVVVVLPLPLPVYITTSQLQEDVPKVISQHGRAKEWQKALDVPVAQGIPGHRGSACFEFLLCTY
jgi:hypothetical protein